jgi:hypothetical protein
VESDSIFLNTNTGENDRFAALSFMGYLLDPNVQMRLAEVGHIPAVITTQPRDNLIQQAMVAFLTGVPYPTNADSELLEIYWTELDRAIKDVFTNRIEADSIENAYDHIVQNSRDIRMMPYENYERT